MQDRNEDVADNGATLFPLSFGNQIRLYSNAYDAPVKKHSRGVFADMFRDLNAAQSHICILGWAISPTEKFGESDNKLPELLVRKAREGIRVILLVWNNIVPEFSAEHKKIVYALEEEIAKIPPHEQAIVRENLHLKFSPRELGYTDHQKIVVADTAVYIGGLDLVANRSDPDVWHDAHARIEGGIVLSAMQLIHARWDGVTKDAVDGRLVSAQLSEIRENLNAQIHATKMGNNNMSKAMQLLCSVREEFWGKDHAWCSPSSKSDHTQEIHHAYIGAIARAKRFIYMENQFFIGNRLHRNDNDTVKSSNLVIAAIVNKIIEKINKGEDFHFYCQLPFRPEGNANAFDVKIILRKQWRTMQWVIKAVDEAAREHGKSAADYITFYNVGRMKNGKYEMKYTHSKLMIVDDRELILGSANCNERSMAGNRDSEVAVHIQGYGAEIANYRERLMCEHFGDEFVSANAKLLLQYPEEKESHELLHRKLDNNLHDLHRSKIPIATPWGNIPAMRLMQRVKPDHVIHRTPVPFSVMMRAVKWAKKMPL